MNTFLRYLKVRNLVLFANKRLKISVERWRYHLLVLFCRVLLVLKWKIALWLCELRCIFIKVPITFTLSLCKTAPPLVYLTSVRYVLN